MLLQHPVLNDRFLECLWVDTTCFIPVEALLKTLDLSIDSSGNPKDSVLTGSWSMGNHPWEINWINQKAYFGDQSTDFSNQSACIINGTGYLTAPALEQIFPIRLNILERSLVIYLQSRIKLPLEEKLERMERRKQWSSKSATTPESTPLKVERNWFYAGHLSYDWSQIWKNQSIAQHLSLRSGFEILGGDFTSSSRFILSSEKEMIPSHLIRWEWVIPANPYISKVSLKNFLNQNNLAAWKPGFQITNLPIQPRTELGLLRLDWKDAPNAEVEVWNEDNLIDFFLLDSAGRGSINLPLGFNANFFRVMTYRPNGEVRQVERRMIVPFDFTPFRKLDYNIEWMPDFFQGSEEGALRGKLVYGLHPNLNLQLFGEKDDLNKRKNLQMSIQAYREGFNFMAELSSTRDFFLRAKFLSAERLNIAGSYRRNYLRIHDTTHPSDRWYASIQLPFMVGGIQQQGLLNASLEQTPTYGFSFLSAFYYAQFKPVNLSVRGTWRRFQMIGETPNYTGYGSMAASWNSFFRKHRLMIHQRIELNYDWNRRWESVLYQFSGQLANGFRWELTTTYRPPENLFDFQVGVVWDHRFFRSQTRITYRKEWNFVNQVSGNIVFHSQPTRFHFARLAYFNSASLEIISYHDKNGNKLIDVGEEKIAVRGIQFTGGGMSKQENGSQLYINLRPYMVYRISMKNAWTEQGFLSDLQDMALVLRPNQTKRLFIPFYSGRELQGRVIWPSNVPGTSTQVSIPLEIEGLHATQKINLETFSDGTFVSSLLPPGKYRISVSEAYREEFGIQSNPEFIEVEIDAGDNSPPAPLIDFYLVKAKMSE